MATDRPDPYPVDTVLQIFPHKAPTTDQADAQLVSDTERQTILAGDVEAAVFQFPAPSTTRSLSRRSKQELRVIKPLAGSTRRAAQLLHCEVDLESPQPRTYVAKVFDPLYYGTVDDFDGTPRESLTKEANHDYSCEAGAYQRIEANKSTQPASCTPVYFGTWCFEVFEQAGDNSKQPPDLKLVKKSRSSTLTKPSPSKRIVCLVLMEYIDGRDLFALRYRDFPVQDSSSQISTTYRLNAWARLIEAETWLKHIGINHNDLQLQNVIMDPPPERASTATYPRIIIFDFAYSTLEPSRKTTELAENPVVRWWHWYHGDFSKWCPPWWHHDLPKRRKWLLKEFGEGDAANRYKTFENLGDPNLLSEQDQEMLAEFRRYGMFAK